MKIFCQSQLYTFEYVFNDIGRYREIVVELHSSGTLLGNLVFVIPSNVPVVELVQIDKETWQLKPVCYEKIWTDCCDTANPALA